MKSLSEYIDHYRENYTDWSEEVIVTYATMMYNKMRTVKKGNNVIHLDYFDGLIIPNEISEIEKIFEGGKIKLSRFDKNGIPYNSIEDFTLQVSLYINNPIIQNILLGVVGNILWDSIKNASIFIWKTVKMRHWDNDKSNKKQKINFGLRIKIDKEKSISLNLDSELTEEIISNALDEALELIKELNKSDEQEKPNESSFSSDFYVFDKEKNLWLRVDVVEEIRKKRLRQNL